MDERNIVVTLIHGTIFLRSLLGEPVWIQPGSSMRKALEAAFPGRISFREFYWSGKNSVKAREETAERLKNHIADLYVLDPNGHHFMIAHSHGGNIALYALFDPVVATRITGLITLSTPFLHARHRQFGAAMRSLLYTCVVALLTFAIIVLVVKAGSFLGPTFRNVAINYWEIGFLVLIPIVAFAARATVALWIRKARYWQEHIKLAQIPAEKLLILRKTADEASGALAATQFVLWLLSQALMMVAYFTTHVEEKIKSIGLRIPIGLVDSFAGVIAAPFVFSIALVALLPLGTELGICSPLLDLSAETTPPGRWSIYQSPQATEMHHASAKSGMETSYFSLMHSSHSDPECIAVIANWILARI